MIVEQRELSLDDRMDVFEMLREIGAGKMAFRTLCTNNVLSMYWLANGVCNV